MDNFSTPSAKGRSTPHYSIISTMCLKVLPTGFQHNDKAGINPPASLLKFKVTIFSTLNYGLNPVISLCVPLVAILLFNQGDYKRRKVSFRSCLLVKRCLSSE